MDESIELYTLGLLPGPLETEEEFLQRARENTEHSAEFLAFIEESFSMHRENFFTWRDFYSTKRVQALYDINPTWALIVASSKEQSFWEGACTYIYEAPGSGELTGLIQIRAQLLKKKSFLSLYSRDEILDHELIHLCRMAYPDSRFEEFFAYQSSRSKLRRLLGPLCQNDFLFRLTLFSFFSSFFVDIWALSSVEDYAFTAAISFKSLSFFFLFILLARFARESRIFYCSKKALERLFPKKAHAVHYRLLDDEIKLLATKEFLDAKELLEAMDDGSFRWKMLQAMYKPCAEI